MDTNPTKAITSKVYLYHSNINDLPMILTPKDVITFLNMSQDQVYRLFKSKKFPSEKINSKHIITKPKLLKWIGVQ